MMLQCQNINEELAKGLGRESMSSDILDEIEKADNYLVSGSGSKPVWLDDFFDSNRNKLIETICRASSRSDGISSFQGYSEGYFNEIIQNANDLNAGNCIDIHTERKANICYMKCRYQDNGFNLSNIYGFLNREMSDKSYKNSQTGKYGVGIKSFFKFVKSLEIISNVRLRFAIDDDTNVSGEVCLNPEWDKKNTELILTYDIQNQSSFNTDKLTSLIDSLSVFYDDDLMRYFLGEDDKSLVFDIRSLLFMHLKECDSDKKAISRIRFSGRSHTLEIECLNNENSENIKYNGDNWLMNTYILRMTVDEREVYNQEYIVFCLTQDDISYAFPAKSSLDEHNRLYSTYYLKTDIFKKILPSSMLINSRFSNIYRNDVGESDEIRDNVYAVLKNKIKSLFRFMCSKEMTSSCYKQKVSDIFHSLLLRYFDDINSPESPFNIDELNNSYLPKCVNECGKEQKYVVVHESKEKYEIFSPMEGDISRELTESYNDYVERKDVIDYFELTDNDECIFGVKKAYSFVRNNYNVNNEKIVRMSEILNYFDCVKDYFAFAVSGDRSENSEVSDLEIDIWLNKLKNEVGKYFNPDIFLKLIGRYSLNKAVSFDGAIINQNLNFKDYLFNGIMLEGEGYLSRYQNRAFDEKYSELKNQLSKKRFVDLKNEKNIYNIRCIVPEGRSRSRWNGSYDYYSFSNIYINNSPLTEPDLLLEKIATDMNFRNSIDSERFRLFEKRANSLEFREEGFVNSSYFEQQVIDISCMRNITVNGFYKFINAVKYKKQLDPFLSGMITVRCLQESIYTQDIIENILPLIFETQKDEKKAYILDEFNSDNVVITDVIENTNDESLDEARAFIKKISGYDISVYRFNSKSRRSIIAYLGDNIFSLKPEASKSFRTIARYSNADSKIYIFYDNYKNVNDVLALVFENIGLPSEKLELLQGYINNGNNIKTMNYLSMRRNLSKVHRKLIMDWCDIQKSEIPEIYNNEVLYRILTARGSYDIYCPICSEIPFETFDYGEDTKKRHSRKIIVLENENKYTKDEVPYIITVACSYCIEKLKNTLSISEFDGKNLKLTTLIAHGQHEKMKNTIQIELSPVNIEIMKKFKV